MTERQLSEAEALEQAELRKRLAEAVAQQQAHRAQDEKDEGEERQPPPPVQWSQPKDSGRAGELRRLVVRLAVFVLLVTAAYFIFRQVSYWAFAPELEVLATDLPSGPVAADQPVEVSAKVTNTSLTDAAAFAVAVFANGQEVEGTTVPVPPGDTVVVPVQLRPTPGYHVFSLVVFGSYRGVHRLRTFPGLSIDASTREFELADVLIPAYVRRSQAADVQFSVRNRGHAAETVVPGVVFRAENGDALEAMGSATAVPTGESAVLRVKVPAADLPADLYMAEVFVRTPTGEILGQARYPVPLRIRS